MGHGENVQAKWYRQPSSTLERLQVGKLMMLQERNLFKLFKGKDLADISYEGM
jgi:hypothetical protein